MKHLITRSTAAAMLLMAAVVHGADDSIEMIDPANFNIDQEEIASIRAKMQAAVDGGHIAGALLLVGNEDGVGMLETVGSQGPNDDTPVDEETIFRIYSMTKPIISVAAMSLVEDGLLRVEDPDSKYIPEFSNMQVINADGSLRPAARAMTVEDLLTHQSGLIQAIFSPNRPHGKMYQEQIHRD